MWTEVSSEYGWSCSGIKGRVKDRTRLSRLRLELKMFKSKKQIPKYNVHLKLRIANNLVSKFCDREYAKKIDDDADCPIIKKTKRLDGYDNLIQKAEAALINHSPELWYHHGCDTFASSSNMIIDLGGRLGELEFKSHGQWFTLESADTGVCVFFAPRKHFLQLVKQGHLGHVGLNGIESEVEKPGGFRWLEGIHQALTSIGTNSNYKGIRAVYTNEAAELSINLIFEGGEHPLIRDE